MLRRSRLLILSLLCALLWSTLAQAGTLSVVGTSHWVRVGYIVDGDTFHTTNGQKIRLLGINTPEIAHNSEPGQPYGTEAKRRLAALISDKVVRLEFDREKRDQYGRTLAHVYLDDGQWINRQLVLEGLAHVYTFAPNFRHTSELLRAEQQARNDMRGLWKSNRFRVLDAADLSHKQIGQFRLIRGYVKGHQRWRFHLRGRHGNDLTVTVPRKARRWFTPSDLPQHGQKVLLRGRIRVSMTGQLYLALHTPYDLQKL